jgi:hypothetical protein
MGAYLAAFSTLYGSFAIAIAFASPWLALMLYGIFLMSKVNPVGTFNRLIPRLNGILKLGIETN